MGDELVKVVCSCIPGFETIAINECNERLQLTAAVNIRGRIMLQINIDDICKLVDLRSVHHYWVVVEENETFFTDCKNKEEVFTKLKLLPENVDWNKALRTWKLFKVHKQQDTSDFNLDNGDEENDKSSKRIITADIEELDKTEIKKVYEHLDPKTSGELLSFRVTSTRTGNHCFSSMESAVHLGAGVNELFFWKVDLKHFDIEVVAFILDNSLSIGIQLTQDSQSLRNITHFGPTTLKANISFCLLKLANPDIGDVVCDPMCGGGSISLEGSVTLPLTFQLAGDNHPKAVENARKNCEALEISTKDGEKKNPSLPLSIIWWDVYQLPIRTASVDHVVTDLPFGKKIGNKERNLFLYPIALVEMARICRPRGKAILLTLHKQAMKKATDRCKYWKVMEIRKINMGGMNVSVYILQRTSDQFVKADSSTKQLQQRQHKICDDQVK